MVFESVNEISNAKNLEDKYQFEIDQLLESVRVLQLEKVDLEQTQNKFMKERDVFRDDLKTLKDAKEKLEKLKE